MADISKITTLDGSTYDIKDATARSSIPAPATASPVMDGTAAVGTSSKYAKEDHVHPSDSTKLSLTGGDLTGDVTNTGASFITKNRGEGYELQYNDGTRVMKFEIGSTNNNPPRRGIYDFINSDWVVLVDTDNSVSFKGVATTADHVSGSALGNSPTNSNRHIWFSHGTNETERVYTDNFTYNPATDILTVGSVSGKINNCTVEASVPSNAVFTDTTYDAATATPLAAGTASVGTSSKYAREDHVHPLQTISVDATLSSASIPADAKAVGDAIEVNAHESANIGFKTVDCCFLNTTDDTPAIRCNATYTDLSLLVFKVTPGATYTISHSTASTTFRVGWGTYSYDDIISNMTGSSTYTVVSITEQHIIGTSTRSYVATIPNNCNYLYIQLWGRNSGYILSDLLPTLKVIPSMLSYIPAPPTSNGTYLLQAVVSSGVPTYTWESASTWTGGSY